MAFCQDTRGPINHLWYSFFSYMVSVSVIKDTFGYVCRSRSPFMFARILKALGIVALIGLFLFAAVEVWLSRNKEKIFRQVQDVVNENLNGDLEIEDISFRPFYGGLGLNFTLSNVRLTDSLIKVYHKPLLNVALIHVTLDFNGIYKGDFRIKNLVLQDGSITLFKTRNGYSNLSIFQSGKPKKKPSGDGDGIIRKFKNLRFVNFGVSFADSSTGKSYGAVFHDAVNTVSLTDSASNAHFKGSVYFNGLVFRPEKGGFLIQQETELDLYVGYDPDDKLMRIYPSTLVSATKDTVHIGGSFNWADTVSVFKLNFKANKIPVDNALPLLARRIAKQIDSIGIRTRVDADVKLVGMLSKIRTLPRVDVRFKTDTFHYDLPIGTLRKMKAEGLYTNQGDTLKEPDVTNAKLIAPSVTGFFETVPVAFKFELTNLVNPRAIVDGSIRADSTNLDPVFDPSRYRFKHGSAAVDFHFNGNLKNFYNPKTDRFDGSLYGKVSVKNVSIDYLPRSIKLQHINGDFVFNEKALVFPDLRFSDSQNLLLMQGKVMDAIPYLFGSPKPLRALVNVNIPTWQLNWLETLLAARKNGAVQRKRKVRLADLLDNAIDNMEVVAKLQSKQLRYRNFVANNVRGEFAIKNNSVRIENFSLRAFGAATAQFSGEMNNSGSGLPFLKLKGKVANADVHRVFSSFDNFGQKTITSQNIKGKLNADFQFESRLANNVKIVPSSMRGSLHFDLNNGYLINFEPLLKIKKLIFKKRNFERVEFAPIRSTFNLTGQEIAISPMEIESNVITLFIDGIYSFAKNTDINIEIPLSNLKKRDSTYVLNPNNPEMREGSKIFLRAVDEGGEVNIKLAFRKKKKDKEKDKLNR